MTDGTHTSSPDCLGTCDDCRVHHVKENGQLCERPEIRSVDHAVDKRKNKCGEQASELDPPGSAVGKRQKLRKRTDEGWSGHRRPRMCRGGMTCRGHSTPIAETCKAFGRCADSAGKSAAFEQL